MRIAYLVSRFPHVSETFIVRELDAVAQREGIEIELLSLYPPVSRTVHPLAEKWVPHLRRPRATEAARAILYWLPRKPLTLLAAVAMVVRGYARRPPSLLRALATLPLAAAHARVLQRARIDHVHAHYATYPALAAWLCRRLTRVPYSITVHAHDIYIEQSLLREKLRDARFVVAISRFNQGFLKPFIDDSDTPLHVVHCGIDTAAYTFTERVRRGPPTALCVASLQEYKGHQVLLEALTAEGLEDLRLDLVGEGPLRHELESRARKLGVADRVRFRGGLKEHEVAEALADADMFVLPSIIAPSGQMEGLPVALMEAMAAGVPVVSTRVSGIPELVRDGDTGLLAEPGDAAALAAVMRRTLRDAAGARERARAARRLVEREFDIRDTAAQLAQLLRAAHDVDLDEV